MRHSILSVCSFVAIFTTAIAAAWNPRGIGPEAFWTAFVGSAFSSMALPALAKAWLEGGQDRLR